MKCIKCGIDNKLRERKLNSGKCKNCSHRFVFEPTSHTSRKNLTDQFFANAIAQISANNTLYFTVGQFKYFIDRKFTQNTKPSIIESKQINIHRINFNLCLGISVLVFLLYTVLNIYAHLTLVKLNIEITPFSVKFFLFLITSFLACFFKIKDAANSSSSDEMRSQRLQADTNIFSQLLKDALILIIGIILSQFFYFSNNWSYVLLGIIAIYLGRYISNISIYLGDLIKGNRAVIKVTQKIYNPGWFNNQSIYELMNPWQKTNGSIKKLLSDVYKTNIKNVNINNDITAYSFDKLLVCDSDIIAQFFIANNFHFETSCAIFSITKYPESIFEITMQMLRRNPDLKVYALHNCSPGGVSLVHYLRSHDEWFKNSDVKIIDLGILPRQVLKSQKIWIKRTEESASQAQQLSAQIQQSLRYEELKWLMDGNFVELESLQPQKLIQILNRSIAANQNLDINDDNLIVLNDGSSTFYNSIESFG